MSVNYMNEIPEAQAGSLDDLCDMQQAFSTTEAAEEMKEPPDGRYQVVIHDVSLDRTKGGKRCIRWKFRILAPNYVGRYLFRTSVLAPEGFKWLKRDLAFCGLPTNDIMEMVMRLPEIKGAALEVAKITKDDFANIYINKKITLDEAIVQNRGPLDDLPF